MIRHFLIGILPHFLKLHKKWNNNRSITRLWVGPFPVFSIGSAEGAEVILGQLLLRFYLVFYSLLIIKGCT